MNANADAAGADVVGDVVEASTRSRLVETDGRIDMEGQQMRMQLDFGFVAERQAACGRWLDRDHQRNDDWNRGARAVGKSRAKCRIKQVDQPHPQAQ